MFRSNKQFFRNIILASLLVVSSNSNASFLGMTWGSSQFVSFDPYTGQVLSNHGGLDPNQSYVGLTRDPNLNVLYAAAQSSNHLYKVDVNTGDASLLGAINAPSGYGVTSITFDEANNSLYATIVRSDIFTNSWISKLVTVDVTNGSVLSTVELGNLLVSDLTYNSFNNLFYAWSATGSDQYGAAINEQISTVNPITGQIVNLFPSPEETLSGFGVVPSGDKLIGWTNRSNGAFFTEINLATGTFTLLANSSATGVCCSGFIYEDFALADVNYQLPPPPPPGVPVPPAIWLFGSGLIGLLAIANKKQQNT